MPSSPSYVRDYKQERRTSNARGEHMDNVVRKRARRLAIKKGMIKPGEKKDIDHTLMLSKGGSGTSLANLRVASVHDNRSFKRRSDGSAVNNE